MKGAPSEESDEDGEGRGGRVRHRHAGKDSVMGDIDGSRRIHPGRGRLPQDVDRGREVEIVDERGRFFRLASRVECYTVFETQETACHEPTNVPADRTPEDLGGVGQVDSVTGAEVPIFTSPTFDCGGVSDLQISEIYP